VSGSYSIPSKACILNYLTLFLSCICGTEGRVPRFRPLLAIRYSFYDQYSIERNMFRNRYGSYELQAMHYRPTDAPASFQRFMNGVFIPRTDRSGEPSQFFPWSLLAPALYSFKATGGNNNWWTARRTVQMIQRPNYPLSETDRKFGFHLSCTKHTLLSTRHILCELVLHRRTI